MKKILNISLLVITLLAMLALCGYFIYAHFNSKLEDVTVTADYVYINEKEIYDKIYEICDTTNNVNIRMIDVDSIVNMLESIPWVTNAEANINLKSVLEVVIEECKPIVRIYNTKGESVYVDDEGNVFPDSRYHTPYLLVCSGYNNFQANKEGNVEDEIYAKSRLPEMFKLAKSVLADDYAKHSVKQIYYDKNKNYIFSLNNTDIIVIFGVYNDVEEKLFNMKQFFMKMQGNPDLDNYKEMNLNYKNQVICTKKKNK